MADGRGGMGGARRTACQPPFLRRFGARKAFSAKSWVYRRGNARSRAPRPPSPPVSDPAPAKSPKTDPKAPRSVLPDRLPLVEAADPAPRPASRGRKSAIPCRNMLCHREQRRALRGNAVYVGGSRGSLTSGEIDSSAVVLARLGRAHDGRSGVAGVAGASFLAGAELRSGMIV